MELGNFNNNHQKHSMATSMVDDQYDQPNTGAIQSHNHPIEATLVAPPLGPMSDELKRMTNNIQDSTTNSIGFNPQSKTRKKAPKHASQTPRSKAPITPPEAPKDPQAPESEPDLYMPMANIVRIMKRGLPPNAKVAEEAKEKVQECVTEFISFVTSEANEACKMEHRKTITAEDLIAAMSRLGFDNYVQTLMAYLQRLHESDIPSVRGCGAGNMGTGANAVTPTIGLPPLDAVYPQFPMFRAAVSHGGSFVDGFGRSTGPITKGQGVDTVTICDGSGPTFPLEFGGWPSGDECGGPSRSSPADHVGNFVDGLGTSTGPITKGQGMDTITIYDGSSPSFPLEIGDWPTGDECGGPSRSSPADLESHDIYGQQK